MPIRAELQLLKRPNIALRYLDPQKGQVASLAMHLQALLPALEALTAPTVASFHLHRRQKAYAVAVFSTSLLAQMVTAAA